jgi:hypothetical protein
LDSINGMDARAPERLLPVRPRPAEGESTMGYVARVADANGYGSVFTLCSAASTGGAVPFEELCRRLALSAQERRRLFGPLPRRWGEGAVSLGLTVTDFNHSCRRWCPRCLDGTGVMAGDWDLKLACACTTHSTWLVDVCPRCGLPQGRESLDLLHCPCGALLSDMAVDAASGPVVQLTLALCGRKNTALIPDEAGGVDVPSLHRMVRYLAPFALHARPAHPGQLPNLHRQETAKKMVSGAAQLLDAWPLGFHALLGALQGSAARTMSVRDAFSP